MSAERGRFWKIPLTILCILGPFAAWLGFGERGLFRLYNTEIERQEYVERIRELAEENQALLEEVRRLRSDMKYVEAVARRELNLIKKNEAIYKFKKKASGPRGPGPESMNARKGRKERTPQKEVRSNDGKQ